jgi:hypothetical protein
MIDGAGPARQNRVFHTFRRWPLVPTNDLVKLRQSLLQVQDLGGPTAAGELLVLVEFVLHRRAHTPQEKHASGTSPGPQ